MDERPVDAWKAAGIEGYFVSPFSSAARAHVVDVARGPRPTDPVIRPALWVGPLKQLIMVTPPPLPGNFHAFCCPVRQVRHVDVQQGQLRQPVLDHDRGKLRGEHGSFFKRWFGV